MTLLHDRRVFTTLSLMICLVLAGLVAAPASPAQSKVRSFTCPDVPRSQTPAGVEYLNNIRVRGAYRNRTSACKSARSLMLRYAKCRRDRGGGTASCNGRTINGLKCTERRNPDQQSRTELNATVTCSKGSKRISHAYQVRLR